VSDFLSRYEADALRYYLTIAGPETQDTDFTWSEFVRRTNDELVANWGNLVNRTLQSAYKNFGHIPEPGQLTDEDRAVRSDVSVGFDRVGDQLERARFKAALADVMQLATRVNQYVSEQAPWAVIKTDRERAATILNVTLGCIDDLKVLFAPFLPFSSQAVHEFLGHDGFVAGPLEIRDVAGAEGETHAVLTGEYASWVGRWQPSTLPIGQPLREPSPLFAKLDPDQVVAAELARMEEAAAT
jgi:methionyl-tRNA synthetase